jgi:phosphate transport system substrate-binding protein
VGNKTTSSWRHLGTAALLLGASCGLGDDPDPREHRPQTFSLVARGPVWQPPTPVTDALDVPAQPAPLFESAPVAAPTPAPTRIALGNNARQVFDAPLQRAFTALQADRTPTFAPCTDRDAIELLLVGRAEYAVIGEQLSAREQQAGLHQTRLGIELFALAVAPEAPVRSLTRSQVRQVFTGQVTEWRQLGFDGGTIVVVVPSDAKLAERASRALIPGDGFVAGAVRVASDLHVADQLLQHKGAIGIVRVTASKPSGMKLLPIDWCPPTAEAFGYGTYPFGVPLHLVTAGPVAGEAQRFLEFVRGDAAREQLAARLALP